MKFYSIEYGLTQHVLGTEEFFYPWMYQIIMWSSADSMFPVFHHSTLIHSMNMMNVILTCFISGNCRITRSQYW